MVGSRIGVATQLKEKVNLHMIDVHCVAHRKNLVSLEAAKGNVNSILSTKVDNLINSIYSCTF